MLTTPPSLASERLECLQSFDFGEIRVEFTRNTKSGVVGLSMVPKAKTSQRVPHRTSLRGACEIDLNPSAEQFPFPWEPEPLVQLKWQDDPYPAGFSNGHTLRDNVSTTKLKFLDQQVVETNSHTEVVTFLGSGDRAVIEHHLLWRHSDTAIQLWNIVKNTSDTPQWLQLISSFTLGHITPFHAEDAPGRLVVHRYRSQWSAEGRLESIPTETLGLERSWAGYGTAVERFGQVGSMPVRRFFPFVAVEDQQAGVVWAAALAWGGSWQLELSRKDDSLAMSGGLSDADFGQWTKVLYPGEVIATPRAFLTTVSGDLHDACHALVEIQEANPATLSPHERDGGIIFNEWCQTWGRPSLARVEATLRRLHGSPVKYFVIDAGWYAEEDQSLDGRHGDWIADSSKFPSGLNGVAASIRDAGLIPGLWFEMETCGKHSALFQNSELLLHRDGLPLNVGGRKFLDFTKPAVLDYLRRRVLGPLKEAGFGYVKIDYNDTIGAGADGTESLGETLRQHIEGVHSFFEEIRASGLILENCSSGGHRMEPSFNSRSDQFSFSDAHESRDIPIIAAAIQHLAPPAKSQIWAVLHPQDSLRRLSYSLCATFLGRMCLSGQIEALSPQAWDITVQAMEFYQQCWPVIQQGRSRQYGPPQPNRRHPHGWQAVVRHTMTRDKCMVVVHTFSDAPLQSITIALPGTRDWRIVGAFPSAEASLEGSKMRIAPLPDDSAVVFLLDRVC